MREMSSLPGPTSTPGREIAVIGNDEALIIDNFLLPDEAASAWRHFGKQNFRPIHGDELIRAYRFEDGEAYWAEPYQFMRLDWSALDNGGTGTMMDVPDIVCDLLPLCREMFRSEAVTSFVDRCGVWDAIVTRAYLYPAGTGLSWHNDGDKLAAFIYYAHPEWQNAWGGELLIAPAPQNLASCEKSSSPDAGFEAFYGGKLALDDIGFGSFIVPKPNRLVVIGHRVRHAVKRVENSVGSGFRATLSGFFLRPDPA